MLGGYKKLINIQFQGSRPHISWIPLLLFAWLSMFGLVHAQNNNAAISQGFHTNETNIIPGALMSLEPQNQGRAQLANSNRTSQLLGVVGNQSLVSLSTSPGQVQIVTSGVTLTLVSDINGSIKSGDKITTSPIDGVGMKATQSTEVVGTAQDDFTNANTKQLTVIDRQGKKQIVHAGLLLAQINVTYYPVPPAQTKTFLPSFLQQIANSVAGREVSVVRVLIGLLVLLLGFVCSGVLLYSSVQSSIISIGRNPLSQGAVHKSLLQVGATAIGILLVMVIAIYLILTT